MSSECADLQLKWHLLTVSCISPRRWLCCDEKTVVLLSVLLVKNNTSNQRIPLSSNGLEAYQHLCRHENAAELSTNAGSCPDYNSVSAIRSFSLALTQSSKYAYEKATCCSVGRGVTDCAVGSNTHFVNRKAECLIVSGDSR